MISCAGDMRSGMSMEGSDDFTQMATPPPCAVLSNRSGELYPGKLMSEGSTFSAVNFLSVTIATSG